jgi:VanZ family protein
VLVKVLRLLLFLAIIAILAIANLSPGAAITATSSDKLDHFLAFLGISFLAVLAFPRTGVFKIFLGLAILNAMIELTQQAFALGRQMEFTDWLFGMLGTVPALLVHIVRSAMQARKLRLVQSRKSR